MVRLRNALFIVALAAMGFGCAHWGGSHPIDFEHLSLFHCSECDDFPAPAYGPNYSMLPGSYSGPAPESTSSLREATPTSSNIQPSNSEAVTTPPDERPIPPTNESAVPQPSPANGTQTPPNPPAVNP